MSQIPKVIQIQTSRSSDFWNGGKETVVALCEDGSLWALVDTSSEFEHRTKMRWRPVTLERED